MDASPRHEVLAGDAGQRLDRYLRKLLPDVPLSAIFKHLRSGAVRVDGAKAEPGLRLQAGMSIELRLRRDPAAAVAAPAPAARKREYAGPQPRIVHQDADVLVVDKPGGMAAQPGTGHDGRDLVSWLRASVPASGAARTFVPAPAHRIDAGTSGLCAIGLSAAGLRGLTAAFRDGTVRKVYLAVVHGAPPERGTCTAPLREVEGATARQPRVLVDPRGRPAHTEFTVQRRGRDCSLLRVTIATGRMHQIRVHLAHLGHPIVGDVRYGSTVRRPDGFLLHAAELHLQHPVTGAPLDLVAPPPPSLPAALER